MACPTCSRKEVTLDDSRSSVHPAVLRITASEFPTGIDSAMRGSVDSNGAREEVKGLATKYKWTDSTGLMYRMGRK